MRQLLLLFPLLLGIAGAASALDAAPEFTLHKIESGQPGPTVLVIGGIQGDEPGGFHAASMLVTNYKATSGSIWVVPNLNFNSIINRSRGLNGDMNRKFKEVGEDDPDYRSVNRIKTLIRDPQIDFIFNLHDGSGFYRPTRQDKMHNPDRWGQSIIIDQEVIETSKFANVGELSRSAILRINQNLLKDEHIYHLHNTYTHKGNKEMEKTLTYYAINNGKAAVGIEASKNLPTHERVYYHLQVMESLLDQLGIEFERDFELQSRIVKRHIDNDIRIAFADRLMLDVAGARKQIRFVPLQQDAVSKFIANNPLVAITPKKGGYRVSYGNRRMTNLDPEYFDYDHSLSAITMEIDGEPREVPIGTIVHVEERFAVPPLDGYRVNVIGWRQQGLKNESGVTISQNKISRRFSVDRKGKMYRVELYRGDQFSGMVLVKFATTVAQLSSKNSG
ncbi:MAG: succinylglutamate desuccinylase/aspartoacylase family protein [Gammaproteobacteria bacterium]|nr:succinylglutamate desuccinylase/aspartoacylase family protein [Gammaproteobacteria bacterium]